MQPQTMGLVVTLALALLMAPLATAALLAGKVYRIGFLRAGQPPTAWVEAFQQGLRERGYVDGQTVVVEFRVTDGSLDPLPQLAEELVRSKVDIILASSSPSAVAAKNATTSVPIVFVNVFDPVEIGLVPSLGHPGGNITGLAAASPELTGKRLELLRELVPQLRRVAVLSHPATPSTPKQLQGAEDAVRALSMQVQSVPVHGPDDFDAAFKAMRGADGLLLLDVAFFTTHRAHSSGWRTKAACPRSAGSRRWWTPEASCRTVCTTRIYTDAPPHTWTNLKGAKPADLPVEQPMKFEFVINLRLPNWPHHSADPSLPGGQGHPIGGGRGTKRGRGTGRREYNHGVSSAVWSRSGLTTACRRRLPASAALPLSAAPDAQRWAVGFDNPVSHLGHLSGQRDLIVERRMAMNGEEGRLIDIGDTSLYVVERGRGYPLIVLHGGPGLDHHMFGDYLDALTDDYRLILVDQRANGRSGRPPEETWTLGQNAKDVGLLATAMGLGKYAVLGHSYGAFVVLQRAVDFPGQAAQTIVSSGVPGSRFLMSHVEHELANFEPEELRQQVTDSWAREQHVQSPDEVAALLSDQLPFHFADPFDPRMAEYKQRTADAVYAAEVLRKFSSSDYGGIEVEDRLSDIAHPMLILAGRHDRTCSVEAAEFMASNVPHAELVVFEKSAHMTFVEENERYVSAVRTFLERHTVS